MFKEIFDKYKKGALRRFHCNKCEGIWNSHYGYSKCPVCKSKDISSKEFS